MVFQVEYTDKGILYTGEGAPWDNNILVSDLTEFEMKEELYTAFSGVAVKTGLFITQK